MLLLLLLRRRRRLLMMVVVMLLRLRVVLLRVGGRRWVKTGAKGYMLICEAVGRARQDKPDRRLAGGSQVGGM